MLFHRSLVALGAPSSANPAISERCNLAQPALTDAGNAQRFADLFTDTVRYVPTRGWFLFFQTHWESISYEAAQFQAELQSALSAILNWAIEGFQRWFTEAPIGPEAIQHATASSREDQDPIALFLAQSCTTAEPEATIPAYTLYQAYCSWARASGERPVSASRFGARALASGLERTRHASGRFYHGLTFLPSLLFSPQSEEDPYPVAV